MKTVLYLLPQKGIVLSTFMQPPRHITDSVWQDISSALEKLHTYFSCNNDPKGRQILIPSENLIKLSKGEKVEKILPIQPAVMDYQILGIEWERYDWQAGSEVVPWYRLLPPPMVERSLIKNESSPKASLLTFMSGKDLQKAVLYDILFQFCEPLLKAAPERNVSVTMLTLDPEKKADVLNSEVETKRGALCWPTPNIGEREEWLTLDNGTREQGFVTALSETHSKFCILNKASKVQA